VTGIQSALGRLEGGASRQGTLVTLLDGAAADHAARTLWTNLAKAGGVTDARHRGYQSVLSELKESVSLDRFLPYLPPAVFVPCGWAFTRGLPSIYDARFLREPARRWWTPGRLFGSDPWTPEGRVLRKKYVLRVLGAWFVGIIAWLAVLALLKS
jgi:hypothetical protein